MNPDFIEVYDGVLEPSQCKELREYIDSQELDKGLVGIRGNIAGYRKDIKDVYQVADTFFSNETWVEDYLLRPLIEFTSEYVKTHPQIDRIDHWEVYNNYNLQKYDPGMCYWGEHCEQATAKSTRMLVWMIYLNTITEGGGTYFGNYDRTLDAVEGRLVIWPAYWTHMHRGVVSNTQTKYIATGWYNFTERSDVEEWTMVHGGEEHVRKSILA